jgi:lysophospholipase L1-like esterase
MRLAILLLLSWVSLPWVVAAEGRPPLTLTSEDRVVFLGNTLLEREQSSAWWELALSTRSPGSVPLFRNLGWSGDTVFGHARAGFGSTADGFNELKKHVFALKPTVLVIGYGTNESFEGKPGLEKFRKGLDTLLDTLAPTKAKIVLLSPVRQGTIGRLEATKQNANLRLYADVIAETAKKRSLAFVDLFELFGDIGKVSPTITDNGIHFTDAGYQWSAPKIETALLGASKPWNIEAKLGTFTHTDTRLPSGPRTLVVKDLSGRATLKIDGQVIVTASAKEWAAGVSFAKGPDFEQREKLRQTIIDKNELYFHRWRPQNVTYLFGFRKHEQGKNAAEIPQFDPLVEQKEKEIRKLSVPVKRTYELILSKD